MAKEKEATAKAGAGCVVRACTCNSQYQDGKYGKGMRVWNKGAKAGVYTCTVCGKKNG